MAFPRSKKRLFLIDPVAATRDAAPRHYRFSPDQRAWLLPAAMGGALLLLSFVALLAETARVQFFFSYLVGWLFVLSISLGALVFVMIQHLTRAEWSVVVRRIPEVLLWNFPLLAVLSIPIFFGMHDLYHWTHEELYDPTGDAYDALLAGKRGFLNTPFFVLRMLVYFGSWIYISYRLYTLSLEQDVNPRPEIPLEQRQVSAWGMLVFALTTNFAAFDLLMSLDPHWFSTIFGVYFFAGSILAALAVIILAGLVCRRAGILHEAITVEHYHDLGKLLFGFTIFWTYIAFSQYFLIWYGNLPEEVIWFIHRLETGWRPVSLALLLGHFIIPFLVLLLRSSKRSFLVLGFMAAWILVIHFVDLYWLAMPVLHPHGFALHWLDVTSWLGFVFLFAGILVYRLTSHGMVPINDPGLKKSLNFHNV